MSIVGGSKRSSKDPGKEVFKTSRTDTSSPEEWVREVEQCASKLRGKKTRFNSLEQTASILIDDFDHRDLKKYPGSGMEKPPCSIAQAANGGPLNCVGRIATLVTIAEDRNIAKDLYRHVVIGVNVNWKGLGANKRVEGGHIFGYIRGTGGDKTYLGKPQDLTSTETYEIDMLPAFYKVNLALAIGLEGNEKQAKVLAVEAQEDAPKESMYLNYLANKIKSY